MGSTLRKCIATTNAIAGNLIIHLVWKHLGYGTFGSLILSTDCIPYMMISGGY